MRYLERLPKPAILEQKEMEWVAAFLASTEKKRPDNSKYGHKSIREQLNSMSFHKCFYCECKLKGVPSEIDHYVEVAERRDLAFAWENLFMACTNCNNKIANRIISILDALNPSWHTDAEIEQHLMFHDESITAKNGSTLGLKTIQKFRLDSDLLDRQRSRQLHLFKDVMIAIIQNQIKTGRSTMTNAEIESLRHFAQADQSFSLLFRLLLEKYNI
jgi:HNH endonuclease